MNTPEKDYSHRGWIAALALIAVLGAVSFIPPQSLGGVKLRRANILSDILSFEDAAAEAAEPALFDEDDFHVDMAQVARRIEAERIEGVYTSANPQTQVDLTKRYNALKAQVLGGLDTYWLAKPLRTGVGHKHTLSVELGDSRKLRAMIDFSYNNVAGVMKGSERTVLSGDVNVSYRKKSFLFRNILSVSNTRIPSPLTRVSAQGESANRMREASVMPAISPTFSTGRAARIPRVPNR